MEVVTVKSDVSCMKTLSPDEVKAVEAMVSTKVIFFSPPVEYIYPHGWLSEPVV